MQIERLSAERADQTLSMIEFSEELIEISKKNAHFTCEVLMASRCIIAKELFFDILTYSKLKPK